MDMVVTEVGMDMVVTEADMDILVPLQVRHSAAPDPAIIVSQKPCQSCQNPSPNLGRSSARARAWTWARKAMRVLVRHHVIMMLDEPTTSHEEAWLRRGKVSIDCAQVALDLNIGLKS